jgi:hypothetical protein
MRKYPLIGVSIIAMILLVLGSLTNVIGYQSVQLSGVNGSPLFSVRTSRASNEKNNNSFTSKYLGKGQNSIPFPVRDNRTELIQKILVRIKAMDDDTFNRFVSNIVKQLDHMGPLKDVGSKEVIKILGQVRESIFRSVVFNDANNLNGTDFYTGYPTINLSPGCGVIWILLFWIIWQIGIYLLWNLPSLLTCGHPCGP